MKLVMYALLWELTGFQIYLVPAIFVGFQNSMLQEADLIVIRFIIKHFTA